ARAAGAPTCWRSRRHPTAGAPTPASSPPSPASAAGSCPAGRTYVWPRVIRRSSACSAAAAPARPTRSGSRTTASSTAGRRRICRRASAPSWSAWRTRRSPPARVEVSPARLETFADGVFAIAATLLILTVDGAVGGEGIDLGADLAHAWPSYVAYVVSFVTIVRIWLNPAAA